MIPEMPRHHIWRVVNNILGRNNNPALPENFLINGSLVHYSLVIANSFNEYFAKISENLARNFNMNDDFLKYLNMNIRPNTIFSFEPVTNQQLKDIVLSLKNTSAGFDGLPMKVFKDNIDILCECITHICNMSLITGVFPRQLMIAMVTCLYKSGDPLSIENYRAISILAAFSKILEKIVIIPVVQYFTVNKLFCKSQFGFRKRMSTEDAVLDIVNKLYDAFDRGETVIGVFLDLSRAFDTLNKKLLNRSWNITVLGEMS